MNGSTDATGRFHRDDAGHLGHIRMAFQPHPTQHLPALVLHTAINTWSFIVPVLPSDDTRRPYFLAVGLMVLIAMGLLLRPGASVPGIHIEKLPT